MQRSQTLKFMIAKLYADLSEVKQNETSSSILMPLVRRKPKISSFQMSNTKFQPPENLSPGQLSITKNIKNHPYPNNKQNILLKNTTTDISTISTKESYKYKKQNISETPTKNEIYYTKKTFIESEDSIIDDDENYYKGFIGDSLAYRYEILETLGKGAFGEVFKCFDHKNNINVAVKIIRNKKAYKESGYKEISFLQEISQSSIETSQKLIVKLFDHFVYKNHLCLVFELLSLNLFQVIEKNISQGLQVKSVKSIIKQILKALEVMHRLKIIHCDIKPDNIMLKDENKDSIRIIDFGLSCKESKKFMEYVQNRNYRAPEIVFDIDYTTAIDLWSLGCITVEMLTGKSLFTARNEQELYKMFLETLGYPEKSFVKKGRRCNMFLDRQGRFKIKIRPNINTLCNVLQGFDIEIINFVEECLKWNPEHRITASQALAHPWIISDNEFEYDNNLILE
ncbi:hypothetical protein SteCoe_4599 [Stentor coeruleus]|uniref:Protein kinase domain-containing protein n=1 Tax=Stentor coeruleus TaxID=5963 RepID=A0A1R2CU89_9CILI|nr:hypothetical protein SteCoe_4599 [Stentor coeruleus]